MSKTFQEELTELINKHSVENGSDTPDYVLAQYVSKCLVAFSEATMSRDKWYNFKPWDNGITSATHKSKDVEE